MLLKEIKRPCDDEESQENLTKKLDEDPNLKESSRQSRKDKFKQESRPVLETMTKLSSGTIKTYGVFKALKEIYDWIPL